MPIVRVGIVGWGLMGAVHARALIDAMTRFPAAGSRARLTACADEDASRVADARNRFGFEHGCASVEELLDDVDAVMVCTPNDSHVDVATAAARAGLDVFCEKPVGRSLSETRQIRDAASAAGVRSMTGYVYRWAPMVRHARTLVESGAIGSVTHYRGCFLNSYASDPRGVLSWRFDQERAGFGALGDLMSHVVDLAHFVCGSIESVVSQRSTTIARRPLPTGSTTHFDVVEDGGELGDVTNEDAVTALATFSNGAQGVFEASRVIRGPDCQLAFEIHGTEGAVAWDFERMNELQVRVGNEADGVTKLISGPQYPGHGAFYPGQAVGLGYEDLATLQARGLLGLLEGGDPTVDGVPTFDDAVAAAEVLHAMSTSWESGGWVDVGGGER
jgi:predicted dehydrogenase